MGYTTEFVGQVTIDPPLNEDEISFLSDLSETRRMIRRNGPLFIDHAGFAGQNHLPDIIDYNSASGEDLMRYSWREPAADWREYHEPAGQPGLWLQWVPTEDGTALEWNGFEKFYNSVEWMRYLIDKLLSTSAGDYLMKHSDEDPRLASFTYDHVLNGTIHAQGEEHGDIWDLVVINNNVTRK